MNFRLPALLLSLSAAWSAHAGTVALDVPVQAGNQAFGGPLGMDFNVGVGGLQGTHLGVFDSGADGLANPINAYIFDRSNPSTPVATINFAAGATGTLINGSRHLALGAPLNLPAGFQGTIVADGYSAAEPLGNQGGGAITPSTINGGGGLLGFVGTSRYGLTAGQYPTDPDAGPANRYLAGTFQFMPTSSNPVYTSFLTGQAAGNQNFGGSLGLDFDVGSAAINVTHLGGFDDGQNGINGTLTAYIYDRSTALAVAGPITLTGSSDPLVSGYRMRDIADVTLPAGFQGSVVIEGYNAAELLYNSNGAAGASAMGNGNGLITFSGGGRFGSAGAYPAGLDGGPANRYLAGNFAFQAVPEPSAAALLAGATLLLLRRRKS